VTEVRAWDLRFLPDTSYPLEGAVLNLPDFADRYLDAELVGSNAGLLKLTVGGKLNNVVAGARFELATFGL
jgi:hypothetical protein